MTEAEWWACSDPQRMLEFLGSNVSERKLRLFAVACGRHCATTVECQSTDIWEALDAAERYADGAANAKLLAEASERAWRRCIVSSVHVTAGMATSAASASAKPLDSGTAARAARHAYAERQWGEAHRAARSQGQTPPFDERQAIRETAEKVMGTLQARLARDIFGNPLRPVTIDPVWRTSTVVSLAQAIYDERAFDRLPILADALEDAGCSSREMLDHCRQPGEHVRGCWALDLILSKDR